MVVVYVRDLVHPALDAEFERDGRRPAPLGSGDTSPRTGRP